jgi:hypothetical protein
MKFANATKFHRKSGVGTTAKRQPSPEGLGNNTEEDPSAVGAALNRVPWFKLGEQWTLLR